MEEWRDVKGYDGKYQVSSLGEVINKNKRLLKPYIKGDKIRYSLTKHKRVYIHVLVAKAFPEICGEWFEGCHVHHKDQNRFNNTPENLICLTKEEHSRIHRELGQKVGERNPFYGKHHSQKTIVTNRRKHRKPIIQVDLNGNEIMGWLSCTDCERETGMNKCSINKCCLGKQKTAYGFKWRYAS